MDGSTRRDNGYSAEREEHKRLCNELASSRFGNTRMGGIGIAVVAAPLTAAVALFPWALSTSPGAAFAWLSVGGCLALTEAARRELRRHPALFAVAGPRCASDWLKKTS